MSDDILLEVFVNPLQFTEVDEPWASVLNQKVTAQSILDFICTPGISSDIESIISRYKAISIEKERIFAAPNEQRILDKLIWPLRNAKAGYMCGNYLGTIALCGMVAEMVAVFLFDINKFAINKKEMSEKHQRAVFGYEFEKLGQERRVSILYAFGVINDEIKKCFDDIRSIRRRYLHLWSHYHDNLSYDAVTCFRSAVMLVVASIGQDLREGKLVLNKKIIQYLDKHGPHVKNE
ncbi:MAG: hypothetical protein FJ128_13065 [Deltaproteobacteria bacterium]|nr:hypothetical protein [Deltaproteobacteria bacterium]